MSSFYSNIVVTLFHIVSIKLNRLTVLEDMNDVISNLLIAVPEFFEFLNKWVNTEQAFLFEIPVLASNCVSG